jgi:hypothetical protein
MPRDVPGLATQATFVAGILLENPTRRGVPNSTSLFDHSETAVWSRNSTLGLNKTETDLAIGTYLNHVNHKVMPYTQPMVIALVVIGNVLSLIVMTWKHNRENTTCFLMAVLSVTDLLELATFFVVMIWTHVPTM